MCTYKYFFIFLLFVVKINSQKLLEQKIQSYTKCWTDKDCKENSFCYGNDDNIQGKCKCINGYELIRNSTFYECLPGVKLGDACERDIQCQIIASQLAKCNKYKICECEENANNYTGICYLNIKIGEICQSDPNCYLGSNQYAFCTDGRCQCPLKQRPSEDMTKCISTKKIGEICISDEECATVPNAKCQDSCRCGIGYTLARNGSACLKAATQFDEECTFDGQCSEYLEQSVCIDYKCGCMDGFHDYGNRCIRTAKIGERCQEDGQCINNRKLEKNVKCQNNICTCLFGDENGSCKIEIINDRASIQFAMTLICPTLFFILFRIF